VIEIIIIKDLLVQVFEMRIGFQHLLCPLREKQREIRESKGMRERGRKGESQGEVGERESSLSCSVVQEVKP
jgi:hypothetical protein